MPAQSANANTSLDGKYTTHYYEDAGAGTSKWLMWMRSAVIGETADAESAVTVVGILKRLKTLLGPAAAATLANGAETAVSSAAVQVLAASSTRFGLIVQNTGSNAVRIGITGVTATTGFRLAAGALFQMNGPGTPTGAIFAIRESADSTVLAQQITVA